MELMGVYDEDTGRTAGTGHGQAGGGSQAWWYTGRTSLDEISMSAHYNLRL